METLLRIGSKITVLKFGWELIIFTDKIFQGENPVAYQHQSYQAAGKGVLAHRAGEDKYSGTA